MGVLKMSGHKIKTWLSNEFWFPQKFKLRGKIILILRFIMAVYWTIGWCYRLAHRKWPKIPYATKNITLNGTVIDTITVVEDIWFNDTTCEGNYKNWSHYPDYSTNWGDTIIL